jgi:hypothetical protein
MKSQMYHVFLTGASLVFNSVLANDYNFTYWSGSKTMTPVAVPSERWLFSSSNQVGTRYHTITFYDEVKNAIFVYGGDSFNQWGFIIRNDMWINDLSRPFDNQWSWVHGSSDYYAPGVYGTLGEASNQTYPGARTDPSHFYDTETRKMCLFHGYGLTTTSSSNGVINDMWCYDVEANTFTWEDGTTTLQTYPTLDVGVEASLSAMGGLYGAGGAYDQENKLFYMFGGNTMSGHSNIVWKYDVQSGTVTALSGTFYSDPAVVANPGQFSTSNFPSGRRSTTFILVDNKLVVYGGEGYARDASDESSIFSYLCEAWIYDLDTNEWAFAAGSLYGNVDGVYSGDSPYPKCRAFPVMFHDAAHNAVLIHGGVSKIGTDSYARLGDQWVFDLESWNFTHVSGTSGYGGAATYGDLQISSESNTPGGRAISGLWQEGSMAFLFGGADTPDVWRVDFQAVVSTVSSSVETSSNTETLSSSVSSPTETISLTDTTSSQTTIDTSSSIVSSEQPTSTIESETSSSTISWEETSSTDPTSTPGETASSSGEASTGAASTPTPSSSSDESTSTGVTSADQTSTPGETTSSSSVETTSSGVTSSTDDASLSSTTAVSESMSANSTATDTVNTSSEVEPSSSYSLTVRTSTVPVETSEPTSSEEPTETNADSTTETSEQESSSSFSFSATSTPDNFKAGSSAVPLKNQAFIVTVFAFLASVW